MKQRLCTAHSQWPCDNIEFPLKRAARPDNKRILVFLAVPEVYSGQIWKGQKDGFGLTLYSNGDAYAGEWCQNQRHGWGFLVKSFGCKYEGTWSDDAQTGFGIQSTVDDLKYIGEFNGNRKHGKGLVVQSNGLLYAGVWEQGEPVSRELLFQSFASSNGGSGANLGSLTTTTISGSSRPLSRGRSSGDSGEWMPRNYSAAMTFMSSSSSSSTPVFSPPADGFPDEVSIHQEQCPNNQPGKRRPSTPFSKKFERVQRLSNVISLEEWTVAELTHFLSACGLRQELTDLVAAHRIDGKLVYNFLSCGSESLKVSILNAVLAKEDMDEFIGDVTSSQSRVVCVASQFLQFGADDGGEETKRAAGVAVAVKVFRSRVSSSRIRGPMPDVYYGKLERQQRAVLRDFQTEVKILSTLRHPNITLFLGAVTFPLLCIVTEYVPCGSLFDLLHRHKRQLSLNQLLRIAHEITCAMAYLHSRSILHCDLKSSNILLTEIGSVKICDFGLATYVASSSVINAKASRKIAPNLIYTCTVVEERPAMLGCVGTHQWMSPEGDRPTDRIRCRQFSVVMRGEASTKSSDVYSFGVIFWEMLSRQIPYKRKHSCLQIYKLVDLSLPHIIAWVGYGGHSPFEHVIIESQDCLTREISFVAEDAVKALPDPINSILLSCLEPRPEDRPCFEQLSLWFDEICDSAVLDLEENLRTFFGLDSPASKSTKLH